MAKVSEDAYTGAYTVVGAEGVAYPATPAYRYDDSPVIFDLSVDRAFPNFAQAQAARGEMNIEVRHRTAAAPPTPTTPPPVGAPPPLTQATTPVGGLFDTKVTLPVVGQVPLVAVLAAAVGAYFVFVD